MSQVHRTSACALYFGGDRFLVDMTEALMGDWSVNGTQSAVQSRKITAAAGRLGESFTGETFDMNASVPLRHNAESQKLTLPENVRGIFMLDMTDSERVIAFPAICTAVAVTSATGAIIGYAATFNLDSEAGLLAVDGARADEGGAVAAGSYGYSKSSSGIVGASSGNLEAGDVTVIGVGIRAEGA